MFWHSFRVRLIAGAVIWITAELYGGAAWIEDGALGGIRACVEFPAAPTAGYQE